MARQLNWMLSAGVGTGVTRTLRNRLALTTILAVAPFMGYGRQAYAACTEIGATAVYECSDTSAAETITDNNADVSTLASPPFVVTTGGLSISGNGDIRFTDENASSITNTGGAGLSVRSNGDDGGTDGAVTIITNGTITGSTYGIEGLNYGTGSISITADGVVTGQGEAGIFAFNSSDGEDLTVTTGAQSTITGAYDGITANNEGDGDLAVTANGEVEGQDGNGIFAENSSNGGDLTITTGVGSSVTGSNTGIGGHNNGSGELEITANGTVTGYDGAGIYAYNSADGDGLTVTTGAQSSVTGAFNGIDAENFGGDLEITANGVVTGEDGDGIFASNSFDSSEGENLTITTGAQSTITGSDNGIYGKNFGDGDLKITANGQVTGEDGDGIYAYNAGEGTFYTGAGNNLTVTTGAGSVVTGYDDGIDARNYGSGDLEITANGTVTGEDSDGIYGRNDGGNLTIETGAASVITGYSDGIDARNYGTGDLGITVNGRVTGEDDNGIDATNNGDGNNLEITTNAGSVVISEGHDGINAENYGSGNLEITANGVVDGQGDDGIYASNRGANTEVTTGATSVVTGVDDGIDVRHYGEGSFEITVNGELTGSESNGIEAFNDGDGNDTEIKVGTGALVQGYFAGISAGSVNGQNIEITNDGTVRNLSGESDYLAINAGGGETEITNNGDLIGTVRLNVSTASGYSDTLDNKGFWNTAGGINDFGDGDDEVNNSGTLRAADDPITDEETTLINLEEFNNSGLVSLVDGQEGDVLNLVGGGPGGIDYEGDGGTLAVDAVLGPGIDGESDVLSIDGNTDGTTLVHVNVVNVTGANDVGIPVVVVTNGTTSEEDFDLDGPLNAGFFTWDLRIDDGGGTWHELFTSGVGVGSFEFAAGITGAQEIWHQTTGTLLQRQADLRSLLGGTGVTPVADYAEPVAPTPTAHITPGFWMRGIGAYIERDDEQDGFILDREQTIYGGMAGFDFGTESVDEAWLFGIFGGYLVSDLKFKETNSKWDYEGPAVGAYATYLNNAFHADVTVKADFLDIDIDPDDLGSDDADTDALNLGGRIDAGYKIGDSVYIEPQATLAVVHTDIDDVDIFGGTVEFDEETSFRGRLGLRLGFDHTGADQVVYSADVIGSVWEEFSGNNNVNIVDAGVPDFGASDDPGDTYWDVSAGFSMAAPDGWSGFIRANYLFADDYDAITGNAGVRWAW